MLQGVYPVAYRFSEGAGVLACVLGILRPKLEAWSQMQSVFEDLVYFRAEDQRGAGIGAPCQSGRLLPCQAAVRLQGLAGRHPKGRVAAGNVLTKHLRSKL